MTDATEQPIKTAVVGHVEWVTFARVEHVPTAGEIVHAERSWSEPAGGGAVAAVQLAKLSGSPLFFTALSTDELGSLSLNDLQRRRVSVHAAHRAEPQRQAFTHIDSSGERTITVLGERMVPVGTDPMPWHELSEVDAVYFTGGDVEALRYARQARVLVCTPRAADALRKGDVEIDVLVSSGSDVGEQTAARSLELQPGVVVTTHGSRGGEWVAKDGSSGSWEATPLTTAIVDTYGCGDSFAAGLTYGLGASLTFRDAIELAARCGAANLMGNGAYEGQLVQSPR